MTSRSADSPLRRAARRYADRTALIGRHRAWSFAEFDDETDRLAGGLATLCQPGARVALYMRNAPEYLLLQTAIERAGLVRVPLNVRYTAMEVAHLLADCEATLILHDRHTEVATEEAVARSGGSTLMIALHGPAYGELLASAPIGTDRSAANLDALASITYTSGTSGQPKGVMLSHRNWRDVTRNMLIDRRIRDTDRLAHIGPLTHASGTYFAPFFLRGATSVIVEEGTVDALLAAIERESITGFTCVPSLLTRIVNHPDIDRFDLSSLEFIFYGAEPIPMNTLKMAIAHFGPIFTQNYGLTEAMMTCTFLPPEDHFDEAGTLRSGCIGRPYSFVDIVLRGPDGRPVGPGEIGEITIRSEHMMRGYWRLPEETGKVLRDGWLWSGDLARADADGFITLAGRSKDMIISGGFNIYPQEIEACLTGSPGIVEAAVVGVSSEDFGEMAVAFVVPAASEALDAGTLSDWCKPRLGIKTPKRWRIVPELPKGSNGKIDKAAIRRLAQEIDWQ
jgi:acyl-CoA synthetase (AMP-forming)/AMP-acid ligase II